MIERITWEGEVYDLEWLDDYDDSLWLKVTQVYGFLFDSNNKVVIVKPGNRGWRLPGGGVESEDEDWKDTLIRESIEEADVELIKNSLKIIGVIKVTPISKNCSRKIHYALRCIGKIKNINEQTIDPAENLINQRIFIDPKDFLKYCKWGQNGKIQRDKAIEYYKKLYNS